VIPVAGTMRGEDTRSRRGDIAGPKKALLEQKFHLLGNKVPFASYSVNRCFRSLVSQGGVMTTLQAMCLGAMLAWTPSLVVLALLLREPALDELQRDPS
jgi:hypothetical protein